MTVLGRDPQGQNVWIYPKDRLTGCYVIGANGTGKSTLLLNMISQDIEQGFGVCLLDPHGDLTNAVVNRIPDKRIHDVILLNPLDVDYPFGLNLFTCSDMKDPAKVEHSVEQIVQIFSKVFGMGVETPRLNQYVRHIAYSLVGSGYTMCEIPLLLLDKSFRDRVVTNVTSTSTRLFWKAFDGLRTSELLDRSESTLDRIDSLISNSIIRNIVGQTQTTINFREIMDSSKILLVSLSAQYESLTSLLGSVIIGQLLTAALSRATTSKRRQFNLYADEFQRFSTPSMGTLLTEARKFGIATTIAHQVRSQLDEKNAATALQAGSLICFRLTSEDADELAAEFILTPKEAVKPQQTIPRNVLDYIDRHPNETVKAFSAQYIHALQLANRLRSETIHAPDGGVTVDPYYNFGEGDVTVNAEACMRALRAIQALFYRCMESKNIKKREYYSVVYAMCYLLNYRSYVKFYRSLSEGETDKTVLEALAQEGSDIDFTRSKRFEDKLYEVCEILIKEPILATSTEYTDTTSQQTYADRKNEIANKLVHLERGHAMVKLPGGEYLMETIPDTGSHAESSKKQQIIDITRRKYCRNRHEVEEEIRARQERDEPPTSKRRGTV